MIKMNFRAMVLAAGLGTRMRPLTDHTPKPMIPVGGVTLIDRVLDWVATGGVNEVIVNSFYKAELLEAHLATRLALQKTKPHIETIREDILLETGGGIKNALGWLKAGNDTQPFFSANSDTICVDGKIPAVERMLAAWDDTKMDGLLLVYPVESAIGYDGKGDFFVNADGTLRRRGGADTAPYVFTGVQLLHPRIFANCPEGVFSMNVLYNRGMQQDGTLPRFQALIHDGHWLHVGDPQGLVTANQWFADHH